MSRLGWRSPWASVRHHLGCPIVCGFRLGHQCIGTRDVPLCVAFASGIRDISAPALEISRTICFVWAAVHLLGMA
eukprot:9921793-Alexandrium_andersonii.AAC.1